MARRSDHGVLTFIARRLESTHILVVIALREGFDIPLLSAHLPEIHVGPLSEAASRELLDSVASDLDHQSRRLILDESLGNPLALLEAPRAVRRPGTDGREGPVGSLRLSERLERTFSAQAAGLPRRTQAALLFAALDQELSISDVRALHRTDIDEEATTDVLEPALGRPGIDRWLHRSVSPSSSARRWNSRRPLHSAEGAPPLAEVVADPDRRAWHRAKSVLGADEGAAKDLETVAARAQDRGATPTALNALELAASLTPAESDRARRLLAAAELHFSWATGRLLAGSWALPPPCSSRPTTLPG